MDFEGPYYDSTLIGPNGKLTRLHKGGGPKMTPMPIRPPDRGKAATTVAVARDRDPSRRLRGASSNILSSGFSMNENMGGRSILGG